MRNKILELLSCLPPKDIDLGRIFIDTRNYESLKDLVDSALYMAEKAKDNNNTTSNYFGLDIDKLESLQVVTNEYCEPFLVIDDNSEDGID